VTRKASKTDWAERKVAGGFPYKQVRPQDLILARDVIKLLRQERRWAVRACQKAKDAGYTQFHGNYKDVYQVACDDCAKAIGGGK